MLLKQQNGRPHQDRTFGKAAVFRRAPNVTCLPQIQPCSSSLDVLGSDSIVGGLRFGAAVFVRRDVGGSSQSIRKCLPCWWRP